MSAKKRGWMILSFLLAAVFTFGLASADVEINETNFPDAGFRQFIADQQYDSDGDGKLSDEELSRADGMIIDGGIYHIKDLTGIGYFTALASLNCESNKLTSLDVSRNTELTYLACTWNRLTGLDVSKNTKLKELHSGMKTRLVFKLKSPRTVRII